MYRYKKTMTETIRERALDALNTLRALYNSIPRDLRYRFQVNGVTLHTSLFEPVVRRRRTTCTVTTRRGTQCKNLACVGNVVCKHHMKPTCTALTAKGDPCTCKTYQTLNMCQRHAKSTGLITEQKECSICYCDLNSKNRVKTKCGHAFCRECLETWAKTKGRAIGHAIQTTCPMCRVSIRIRCTPPPWWGARTGLEWMQHLNIIPENPMWSPLEVETQARALGAAIMSAAPRIMSDGEIDIYLRMLGFVRR